MVYEVVHYRQPYIVGHVFFQTKPLITLLPVLQWGPRPSLLEWQLLTMDILLFTREVQAQVWLYTKITNDRTFNHRQNATHT